MVAVYMPEETWALPLIAAINLLFSALFYWLCLGLIAGLKASSLNYDMEVADAWTRRMISTLGAIVLLMSGDSTFVMIGVFTLPWIITNILADMFATLVKWEILQITDKK